GGVTSMESFLKKFFPDVYHQMKGDKAATVSNYCRFDSELLTVFTSSLYVAGLVATLFASSVTTRYGRRASILIGGSVFIAGSAFGGAAVNVYMLLVNRILLGIGLGFTNQVLPTCMSQ
uniref:Major facilitator superfamily (MFS) profile domain-containing protein n=1 Tax=Aegilops tauschii subsp. strangulata TaxID=200361 RepID=A0A453JAY7_AEGTS